MFGIEESHNTGPAGRRKDDISSVSSICNKLRFAVSKLTDKMKRLGKLQPGKNRPLRITMCDEQAKHEV